MTRAVHAVLVSGDPGTTEIDAAVDAIADLLADPPGASLVRLGTAATPASHASLVAAIAAASEAAKDGDLFVLMFAGHGEAADDHRPYQSWVLAGNDRFTDRELANVIRDFKRDVTVVLISACCYGGGMFTKGPYRLARPTASPVERALDQYLNLRLSIVYRTTELRRAHALRYGASSSAPPLICLSAATYDKTTLISELDAFAADIVASALAGETYHDLVDRFDDVKFTGHDFHAAARPSSRMNDVVLDRT